MPLSLEEVAIIAGTRAALGLGVGLLIADMLNRDQRKGAGWALVGVGAVSTIPILLELLDWRRSQRERRWLPDQGMEAA